MSVRQAGVVCRRLLGRGSGGSGERGQRRRQGRVVLLLRWRSKAEGLDAVRSTTRFGRTHSLASSIYRLRLPVRPPLSCATRPASARGPNPAAAILTGSPASCTVLVAFLAFCPTASSQPGPHRPPIGRAAPRRDAARPLHMSSSPILLRLPHASGSHADSERTVRIP